MSKAKEFNLRLTKGRRPDPPKPPGTERINALISVCKANWLALMSYLAFVGVTLIGVVDLDFFIPERRTQLPLIGVTIPTALFFAIAPGLGLMLYAHLHFYLMRLWDVLAQPEEPVSERISPWLVADFALSGKERRIHEFPLQRLANGVVLAMIFLAAPIVLIGFWWRSMPKHDPWLTLLFCGVPLSLSLLIGVSSWRYLGAAMRRATPLPGTGHAWLIWATVFLVVLVTGWVRAVNTFVPYAEFSLVGGPSYLERKVEKLSIAAQGMNLEQLHERFGPNSVPDDIAYIVERDLRRRWWMSPTLWPELLAPAQLEGAVFVETPTDWLPRDKAEQVYRRKWCAEKGLSVLTCGPGPLARVDPPAVLAAQRDKLCGELFPRGEDKAEELCAMHYHQVEDLYIEDWTTAREVTLARLPHLNLSEADLRKAQLSWAQLEGVDLGEGQLQGAILRKAQLEGANLLEARLEGAILIWTQLGGTDLRLARLEEAQLSWAQLEGTNLWNARLEGAQMNWAQLEGTNLSQARLEGASLWEARLKGANLWEARLEGANLSWAHMEGADLLQARLEGANLWGARLEGASLSQARIKSTTNFEAADFSESAWKWVDLSTVEITQDQVNAAFGDASVILPDGVTRPSHWPVWELGLDFDEEWRRWQSDPASYTPPTKPTP